MLPVPELRTQTRPEVPFWLHTGIGGRKLTQIQAFVATLPTHATHSPQHENVLEWCAGKGYLGRFLAFTRNSCVTSVEIEARLCEQGLAAAQKFSLSQRFLRANVLSESATIPFSMNDRAVALHACGGLHTTLMTESVAHAIQAVHIAPCCYHLHGEGQYRPMSHVGRANDLGLSREALKFSVQGMVTGGDRIARLRQQELSWRLSYDSWRQVHTKDHLYRPLPSAPKSLFQGDFATFAQWAAQQHGLTIADTEQWQPYLAQGHKLSVQVRRIELIRHVFRRVLETWLVLDRALYLHEAGYKVQVELFCDYQVTPRNMMIHAHYLS
nr:methyltransferase [Aliidiomarina indica]